MAFDDQELLNHAQLITDDTLKQEIVRMINIHSLSKGRLEHRIFGKVFYALLDDAVSSYTDGDGVYSVTIGNDTGSFDTLKILIKMQVEDEIGINY